jgi:hypothetical protein
MDIKKLLAESNISAVIEELKAGRSAPLPDTGKYTSQLDPSKHDIFDKTKRPDKIVKTDAPETEENGQPISRGYIGGEKEQTNIVPVAIIALAIQ